MSNRILRICVTAVALLLALLFLMSRIASQEGYRNLLLIQPSGLSSPGWSPDRLEDFSEEEFLLTYEIRQHAPVQAVNSRHQAVLVGTNHNYSNVMGYIFLDGGFFTKAAMDAKSRHVVLNETAAYQIFGSSRVSGGTLKLEGETWIITGVVQDYDSENARLYVPARIKGGQADSIMVLMDASVTEAYTKNALKGLGIHESGYAFINLSKSAKAFTERFTVSWKGVLLAAILILILRAGGGLMEKLRFYRSRMKNLYFRELFRHHWPDILRTTCGLLLLGGGAVVVLLLSLQILEVCLTWQELVYITGEMVARDFANKLLWLRDCQIIGYCLFGGCVCMTVLCFILCLGRLRMGLRPKPRLGV